MQMADKDAVLHGFITELLRMQLGSHAFKQRVYVAPISDEMLLGHDLLHHLGVLLDLQSDTLLLKGERIPITTSFNVLKPRVARVTVGKRTVIPPNSVTQLACHMDVSLEADYCIEQTDALQVLMPRTVRKAESKPVVCLVNVTDNFKTLKKKTVVGIAQTVQAFLDMGDNYDPVGLKNSKFHETEITCQAINKEASRGNRISNPSPKRHIPDAAENIPEHLKSLYESSVSEPEAS